MFRTEFGANIFKQKYASNPYETWQDKANTVVNSVCGDSDGAKNNLMGKSDRDQLAQYINEFKFMPGGRYLWYAGREARFYNNCYLLRLEEDTREEWAGVTQRAMSCLMTGGGIGVDVSIARPSGRGLRKTGGVASGPLPLLYTLNEVGRNVMQGGSRRSALYGSMDWKHEDAWDLLKAKNWHDMTIAGTNFSVADAKKADFNYPAQLDMMNVSLNYDDIWLNGDDDDIFLANVKQAMMTGEPGFSFNFGEKTNETLRNACTEISSEDDSDCCNLGSINMAAIESVAEFKDVVRLGSKFLVCGLIRAQLPYDKVAKVRQQNSRIGLGLMGIHEWLLKRGHRYEMVDELKQWMKVYESESKRSADEHCDRLFLNRPKGYRAIAPTGTISILAGCGGSGLEPIYAVAYRRRFLTDGTKWKYQFVVDGAAQTLVDSGISPEDIESAVDLAKDFERRVKFQADVQKFVDHGISSTINIPAWGTEYNNEDKVLEYAKIFRKYAPQLRGLTIYPDGSRGGQPISPVAYSEAHSKRGVVFEDNSEEQCLSGVCSI